MKKIIFLLLLYNVIFANNFDTQKFKPAFGLEGMINTETNDMMKQFSFSAFMYFHYDKYSFVLHQIERDPNNRISRDRETIIVDNTFYSDLIFTFAVLNFMELGIDLPLSIFSTGTDPITKKTINKFNLGDIRTGIRLRFLNTNYFDMGMVLNTYLPTGGKFNTSGGFRFQIMLMNDIKLNKYKLGINIGYDFKSSDYKLGKIELNDEIFYSIGNKYKITGKLDLLLELFGSFQFLKPFTQKGETSLEILAGVDYRITNKLKLSSSFSLGIASGSGTPAFRAILGFGYVPRNTDYDSDGILNKVDKCPNEPEDFDNFEDLDGCPDPDNDDDGILDEDDKCPNDPEDYNGYKYEDGCPDFDNNKDGVIDQKDEYLKGPEDNDKDGIINDNDKCPNEPEDYNGLDDLDGCPDLIGILNYKKINLLFKTNSYKISEKSYPLLDEIAMKIKVNTKIKKLIIEGYTDDRNSSKYNENLSQKRADFVRNYLIEKGVPENKLISKGFGEKNPKVNISYFIRKLKDNITKKDRDRYNKELLKARTKNRRVEFKIIEIEKN